jgi:hypothetical protein
MILIFLIFIATNFGVFVVILKQSYENLRMEKQYNPLLSLPVLIKQSLYHEKEAKALQILLEKFSEKEIT